MQLRIHTYIAKIDLNTSTISPEFKFRYDSRRNNNQFDFSKITIPVQQEAPGTPPTSPSTAVSATTRNSTDQLVSTNSARQSMQRTHAVLAQLCET